jgi:hypothetical protein
VGIGGGHGGAEACALTDGDALVELPELPVVDLLVVDPVLDPPEDAEKPNAPGRLAIGTLRGSQPKSMKHVGSAGLVKKPGAPACCCVGWAVDALLDGMAA